MKRLALCLLLLVPSIRADELPAHALRRFQARDIIPHSPVLALAFKADGKTLTSISANAGILVWDVPTGKHLSSRTSGSQRVAALTLDCNLAALGNYGRVQFWNLATSEDREQIASANSINTLALSPDGSLLVSGNDDHAVEVWETKTGKLLHTLRGHDAYVTAAAFAPSGKLFATGAHDRTIRLWDSATGKELRLLEGHRDQVSAVAFHSDGRTLVSSSWDGTIRTWDVATGKEKQGLKGHRLGVVGISVDAAGKKVASASLDGTARVWDLATGKETLRIDVAPDGVAAVALSADGKLLAAGDHEETVTLWDMKGKLSQRCSPPDRVRSINQGYGHTVALSPDNSRIVSGHGDAGIRLWDAATGKMIRRVGRQTDYVWSVQFSPDGKHVASAGRRDGTVHIWDAEKGEQIKALPGQKGGISKLLYSRDGKRLIAAGGSFDPAIYVWDVEREKAIYRLEGHRDYIDGIALSWDEKTLASASRDGTMRLWDLTTGKETKQLEGAGGNCSCVAFAPDGKTLAAGSSQVGLTLWDLPGGKIRKRFDSLPNGLVHVSYSGDGRTLLAGGSSSFVLLDVLTETERRRISEDNRSVLGMAISMDSRRIVTADSSGSVILWDPTILRGEDRKKVRLDAVELEQRWQDLSGPADKAYEAIWKLSVASEQSLPLFAKHSKPVPGADPKQVARWISELDAKRFKTREQAEKELTKLGDLTQTALEAGLKKGETLEHRRRIETLLERISSYSGNPEMLAQLRMVETLETIGGKEARALLERLAAGDSGARLTREAKATLTRLRP